MNVKLLQLIPTDFGGVELRIISNDTSVVEGSTTFLTCVGSGQPDVEITWNNDGKIVINSSLITIYEEDINQGGTQFKLSILQLCSLEIVDSGGYTCIISNGRDSFNITAQLTVSG